MKPHAGRLGLALPQETLEEHCRDLREQLKGPTPVLRHHSGWSQGTPDSVTRVGLRTLANG